MKTEYLVQHYLLVEEKEEEEEEAEEETRTEEEVEEVKEAKEVEKDKGISRSRRPHTVSTATGATTVLKTVASPQNRPSAQATPVMTLSATTVRKSATSRNCAQCRNRYKRPSTIATPEERYSQTTTPKHWLWQTKRQAMLKISID